MIRRKTKMVSFRVSPDEYHKLRGACIAQDVESVSELARLAMFAMTARTGPDRSVDQHIGDLRERIRTLSAELERLAQHVKETPAPVNDTRSVASAGSRVDQ